jgi:hypothetical protein
MNITPAGGRERRQRRPHVDSSQVACRSGHDEKPEIRISKSETNSNNRNINVQNRDPSLRSGMTEVFGVQCAPYRSAYENGRQKTQDTRELEN